MYGRLRTMRRKTSRICCMRTPAGCSCGRTCAAVCMWTGLQRRLSCQVWWCSLASHVSPTKHHVVLNAMCCRVFYWTCYRAIYIAATHITDAKRRLNCVFCKLCCWQRPSCAGAKSAAAAAEHLPAHSGCIMALTDGHDLAALSLETGMQARRRCSCLPGASRDATRA